jgi:hypothetical protein
MDNENPYEEFVLKPYSERELQKIYFPFHNHYLVSDGVCAKKHIEDNIGILFMRTVDVYEYTYYKTESSKMFVFFFPEYYFKNKFGEFYVKTRK